MGVPCWGLKGASVERDYQVLKSGPRVFTGNANPDLAKDICAYLQITLGQAKVFQFTNENVFVQIEENIRQRDVFLVQSLSTPVNTSIVELLIMIDAAKRASAGRITSVIPYYAYGRTDKKDQPRVPITARLLADLLTTAGADRILTMDLHAGQIQGFFNIPVDELTAMTLISCYFEQKGLDDIVVVATDIGISKRARDLAERLKAPLAIIEKRRGETDETGNRRAESLNIIGTVKGKTAITFDDEIDTAGSLSAAVQILEREGARDIYSCATHGVLSGSAMERLGKSPIKEVVLTDTIPVPPHKRNGKVTVLSVAPLFGEAIRRIHLGESVGALFS